MLLRLLAIASLVLALSTLDAGSSMDPNGGGAESDSRGAMDPNG